VQREVLGQAAEPDVPEPPEPEVEPVEELDDELDEVPELLESDFVDSDFDSDFDSDVPDPESLEDPPAGTVEDEPERLSVR
jgi:hypothetical protein